MLVRNRGAEPVIDPSAFAAPTAVLVGRVSVGPEARIMYGSVLDSEASKVEVGESAIVCENSVLRATSVGGADLSVVGDHAFVGPHATLLGCVVELACYLATGATVLQGATVGSGAVVAVGALVHANTYVPSEFFVPPNTIALGDPLQVYAPGDEGLPSTAGHQEARERRPWWPKVLGRYMKDVEGRVTVLAVVIAGVVALMVEKGPYTWGEHGVRAHLADDPCCIRCSRRQGKGGTS